MAGGTKSRSYMKCILPIELIRKIDPSDQLSSMTILILLYVMQYPDSTVKQIEKLAEVTKSAASRHILILTERGDRARARPGLGLVEHYEDNVDARVKRVRLTPKGDRLANDIAKIMET